MCFHVIFFMELLNHSCYKAPISIIIKQAAHAFAKRYPGSKVGRPAGGFWRHERQRQSPSIRRWYDNSTSHRLFWQNLFYNISNLNRFTLLKFAWQLQNHIINCLFDVIYLVLII